MENAGPVGVPSCCDGVPNRARTGASALREHHADANVLQFLSAYFGLWSVDDGVAYTCCDHRSVDIYRGGEPRKNLCPPFPLTTVDEKGSGGMLWWRCGTVDLNRQPKQAVKNLKVI
ncbi:unnamed protein product [Toxocara canis]|uniref:Uncharacterized protein n=1 Tax=Toxocara canis TaxID=6265 RepID=A0A183V821_TOXCA|nr:unnamed protein product [Toxocara canis]